MRISTGLLSAFAVVACGGRQDGLAGSAGSSESIFVEDVLAPPEVTNDAPCIFTGSPTQPSLSSGVLDVDFRSHYDATYLVGNLLAAAPSSSQKGNEASTVTLQGATVRVADATGNPLTTFTRLAAATVFPADHGVPAFAPITVTTIDPGALASDATIRSAILDAPPMAGMVRLVTYVRFFGATLGGTSVQSDEFEFPVDVCRGCLIRFSVADINPELPAPNCAGNPSVGGAEPLSSSCIVGQDVPVDCIECPAVPDCQGAYSGDFDAGTGE